MKQNLHIVVFFLITLSSCIGTDVQEAFVMDPIIRISSMVESIKQGESYMLEYVYINELGEEVPTNVSWSSSNPSVLSVDNTGLASALQEGSADITVSAGNVSDTKTLSVSQETTTETSKTGSFSGLNNYSVDGTAILEDTAEGLVLNFGADFTTSNGPGLYVYLSNSPTKEDAGLSLGALKSNSGAQSYTIGSGVNLSSYEYVIIYCQPFGVAFGNAKLN